MRAADVVTVSAGLTLTLTGLRDAGSDGAAFRVNGTLNLNNADCTGDSGGMTITGAGQGILRESAFTNLTSLPPE